MPYMNYSPDDDGGSNLTVGPGGGFGPGGGPGGGGGQEAFMEMLAQARMDKLRRQREEEALAEREMLLREGQAGQAASGERDRRRFAETELRGRERGEGQRLALEQAKFRASQPDQMDREHKLRTMLARKAQPFTQQRMSNIKMEAMSPVGNVYKEAVNPAGYGYDDTDFLTSRGLATGGNPLQRFQGKGSSGGGGASIGPGGTTEHQLRMAEDKRRAEQGG